MSRIETIDQLKNQLEERKKELNCLYQIESLLNNDSSFDDTLDEVVKILPSGFQFVRNCAARILYFHSEQKTPNYQESENSLTEPIMIQGQKVGTLTVVYLKGVPKQGADLFLPEERSLLRTVADRLGHYILHQNLQSVYQDIKKVQENITIRQQGEWRVVLDLIRRTDPTLFMNILRKLLHLLCWSGIDEADILLKQSSIELSGKTEDVPVDENKPLRRKLINNYDDYIEAILSLANEHLLDADILARVQKWVKEDKSSGLVKVLESRNTSLAEISDAIRKYFHVAPEKIELSPSTIKGLRVSLIRRFFSNELHFIKIAKEYVKLTDFFSLIDKMIYLPSSRGQLGGKSSGIFLASNILRVHSEDQELLHDIKTPKTWFVSSDVILAFMQYNNLDEVFEQKYKEIGEVRMEYPHVVQMFKNSQFPPEIVKGLAMALDDFGDKPIVVRSSSLLEDQLGAAFSGKYKSLFLANQGSKQERLNNLMDAIAEVYASTFGPDPIEYRSERGLIDFHEEMAIMIMEVVGTKVGGYFFPAFAGVAFSNNEFRWSPRIKREDGLLRLVPGLGTRAVDRIGDDYPILVAPSQPNLKVNISFEDQVRYAPKNIDVINLKTNQFESISIDALLREAGNDYPIIEKIVSQVDGNMIRKVSRFDLDFEEHDYVVTFDGLLSSTKFVSRIDIILKTLQEAMRTPVDMEFAFDGKDLYVLQCRPQSYTKRNIADVIPKDIRKENIIFKTHKYVSNGKMPEITHLVYVDIDAYSELPDLKQMKMVGRAIGKLNRMLPARKFGLIGPGRWGSRGDIKLGVNVTYSDINNTSLLIEVARKKGNYVPDLSFGTHFFQDLVESSIRYLPIYADDDDTIFRDDFFHKMNNSFVELLPEFEELSNVIYVIDIPANTGGKVLKVLMNAEQEIALAILDQSSNQSLEEEEEDLQDEALETDQKVVTEPWRWRIKIAERFAYEIDPDMFGIKGIYLFGSTKHQTASEESDIDLIVHTTNDPVKLRAFNLWLKGFNDAICEMHFLRSGRKIPQLLDVHIVNDDDIINRTSYAAKINAVTNAARPLPMKKKPGNHHA